MSDLFRSGKFCPGHEDTFEHSPSWLDLLAAGHEAVPG